MRNKKIDRLIRDLYWKPSLREELRGDVKVLAERYELDVADIEAARSGDARTLIERGMDPRLVTDPAPRLRDKISLALTRATAGVTAAIFGLALFAPSARVRAARWARARAGQRAFGRRASARVLSGRRVSPRARFALRRRAFGRYASGRVLAGGESFAHSPVFDTKSGDEVIVAHDPIN